MDTTTGTQMMRDDVRIVSSHLSALDSREECIRESSSILSLLQN
jgi:hypothetical protein